MPMVKSGFACFVFMVFVLGTLAAAQDQRGAEKNYQVVLKYLGTAGWEITDGTTSILIDPYLSRSTDLPHREEGRATPWLETPAGHMGGVMLPRRTWRQSIRTFSEQIVFSSLTHITTTYWMFLTSPSKLAP
jgi:hypothetical protein